MKEREREKERKIEIKNNNYLIVVLVRIINKKYLKLPKSITTCFEIKAIFKKS